MDFTTYQQFRDASKDWAERDRRAAIEARRQKHAEEFKTFDRQELSVKSDKDLAEWQSRFDTEEPQWRIAEHEWQRRLTADQIAATMLAARGQAWFGIAGLFIGAILTLLGALLLRLLPP